MVGVSQVVLVALHQPWGSTGGSEEWIGRLSRMVEAKQHFPLWSCPTEAQESFQHCAGLSVPCVRS